MSAVLDGLRAAITPMVLGEIAAVLWMAACGAAIGYFQGPGRRHRRRRGGSQ